MGRGAEWSVTIVTLRGKRVKLTTVGVLQPGFQGDVLRKGSARRSSHEGFERVLQVEGANQPDDLQR